MSIKSKIAAAAGCIAVGSIAVAGCTTTYADSQVAYNSAPVACKGTVTGGVGGAIGGRNINGVTPAYNAPLCYNG